MRTLELINLILLALNLCFYLGANWLVNATNDYFRTIKAEYEAIKSIVESADEDYKKMVEYQEISKEQRKDIYESYQRVYKQYERMNEYFEIQKKLRESENERNEA